jgi:hypothetical protein
MVQTQELVRWLEDSGDTEAARLRKRCSLKWTWATLRREPVEERTEEEITLFSGLATQCP